MDNKGKYDVRPPSGFSPRPEDTPRTRNLKELRRKRIQYFDTVSQGNTDSSSPDNTTGGSTDDNGNRIPTEPDVRSKMLADSRVVAVDNETRRSSTNQRPVTAGSATRGRDSQLRPTGLYGNASPPPLDSIGISSPVLGVGGPALLGPEAALVGRNVVGPKSGAGYKLGSRPAVFNGIGRGDLEPSGSHIGTVPTSTAAHSRDSSAQRRTSPSTSSGRLGFSLPDLSPGELNIVASNTSRVGGGGGARATKKSTGSRKGKGGVKSKKVTNSSPSVSRESFDNGGGGGGRGGHSDNNSDDGDTDAFWSSVLDEKRPDASSSTMPRRSVIDADFEDDYSALGLSVDRGGFEKIRGYTAPTFTPSHRPKTRANKPAAGAPSGMRASQSEHNVAGSASFELAGHQEELHRRSEVTSGSMTGNQSMGMRRSATHEGLSRSTTTSDAPPRPVKIETESEAEEERVSIPDKVDGVPPALRVEGEPRLPKLLFAGKPTPGESTDFVERNRAHRAGSASHDDDGDASAARYGSTQPSSIQEQFASGTLQSILGKDRLERLLKNLEESAWVEEERSASGVGGSEDRPPWRAVGVPKDDMSIDSFRSETEVNNSQPTMAMAFPFAAQRASIEELGLQTHRPSTLEQPSMVGETSGQRKEKTSELAAGEKTELRCESTTSSARRSTKCSYSSDEIYARARKLSTTSAEGDNANVTVSKHSFQGQNDRPPSPAHAAQQQAERVATSLSDFVKDGRVASGGVDDADGAAGRSSKFDYVRGIGGTKKEFYKTVTVTDSTAVSETSMNTAKLSRQSTIESPRGVGRAGQASAPFDDSRATEVVHPAGRPRSAKVGHRRSGSGSEVKGHVWPPSNSQEEHIEGIRQHVADIRLQQFEDKIKAGMPYTTASIERYFASMEQLSADAAHGFEPIPEPEIIETPRKDKDRADAGLRVTGAPARCSSSTAGESLSEQVALKHLKEPEAKLNNAAIGGPPEGRQVRVEQMEKDTRKSSASGVYTGKDELSQSQRAQWDRFKLDNDKRKILNEMLNAEDSDDDDLFTKVTSVVDDEGMTARLQALGIDFEFLKKRPDGQPRGQSDDSAEMEVLSHHSSEESSRRRQQPRKNHNGSSNSEGGATREDAKTVRDAQRRSNEEEVEMLFEMSPRNNQTVKDAHPSRTVAKVSEEPTFSSTLKAGAEATATDTPSDSVQRSGASVVKVCPECAEVNKTYVTWCVECGAVLSGVIPVPFKAKRDTARQLGSSRGSFTLSQSAANFKSRLEESMNYNSRGAAGSLASWLQQSQTTAQGPGQGEAGRSSQNREVLNLKQEGGGGGGGGGVRDSDDFEYEKEESPVRALPKSLQTELSLDLDARAENSSPKTQQPPGGVGLDLAKLSEDIQFEYNEAESPKKLLPAALQEELNLNLSLDGSQTTASFKVPGASVLNHYHEAGVRLGGAALAGASSSSGVKKSLPQAGEGHAAFRDRQVQRVEEAASNNSFSDDADDVPVDLGGDEVGEDLGEDGEVEEGEGEGVVDQQERIVYQQFVKRFMSDPRFKPGQPARPQSALQPAQSAGQPRKSGGPSAGKRRPQSAKSATRNVRGSLENSGYKRRWARSSTMAWSALSHGEVRARSSLNVTPPGGERPTSAVSRSTKRPMSATRRSVGLAGVAERRTDTDEGAGHAGGDGDSGVAAAAAAAAAQNGGVEGGSAGGVAGDMQPKESSRKPGLSTAAHGPRNRVSSAAASLPGNVCSMYDVTDHSQRPKIMTVKSAVYSSGPASKALKSSLMNTYTKYFEMSPRIAAGEFSAWLCLPDEIWLHICSYLRQRDLGRLAQTCMQLHRVALDESLWRSIAVRKTSKMADSWLVEIGRRQPTSLTLVQCHGEQVSVNGLRELFRQCSESLKELNFTGCSRGELTGDNILLHAAARCRHITHLDASWSNVNDNGVMALVDCSHSLESVCLNGCQVVTDAAVHDLVSKHGQSLRTLELFGCFNVSPRSAASIASHCKFLTILNLGQCWKLTDVSIARLAPSLTEVINLDLRGCKQIKDTTIHHLMHHCKKLQSLSVANCPNLTDVALTEIATYCSGIRSLDLCGCKGITDMGVRAIAMACHSLEYLDVSSSMITHKSVSTLASFCHANLEVLKLNFCKHITVPSLVRFARNCKKMKKLYLYGVKGIRDIDQVRRTNSYIWIEI